METNMDKVLDECIDANDRVAELHQSISDNTAKIGKATNEVRQLLDELLESIYVITYRDENYVVHTLPDAYSTQEKAVAKLREELEAKAAEWKDGDVRRVISTDPITDTVGELLCGDPSKDIPYEHHIWQVSKVRLVH